MKEIHADRMTTTTDAKKVSFKEEKGKWNYSAKGLINKPANDLPYVYLDTCATFSMTGEELRSY
jgi:hypothetical protein